MTRLLTESPPATNPNSGKSVTIATKTSPEMLRAVIEIVERGSSPYRNVSAFVRSATQRLILDVAQDTDSSLLPPIIALLKEWSRRHYELSTYEQVVEGMKNNARMLEVYLGHGNSERAVETLEEITGDILNLVDPFWRRVCLDEFWKFQAAKDAVRLAGGRAPRALNAFEVWKESQVPMPESSEVEEL